MTEGGGLQLGDLVDLEGLVKPLDKASLLVLGSENWRLSEAGTGFSEKIEEDRPVLVSDVTLLAAAIKSDLDKFNLIDYYGDEISLEEFQNMEGRELNARVFEMIESSEKEEWVKFILQITYLPAGMAAKMVERQKDFHCFRDVKKFTAATAEVLSEVTGELQMWFHQLDDENVKFFSECKADFMFSKLEDITVGTARYLARFKGKLRMQQAFVVSEEVAEALSGYQGAGLLMNAENLAKIAKYKKS